MTSAGLGGVDLAEIAGRFGELLHAAGVPVTPATAGRFAAALALVNPQRTDHLRALARVTLVSDRVYVGAFNRTFDQVFSGMMDNAADGRNPNAPVPSIGPSVASAASLPRKLKAAPDLGQSSPSRPGSGGSGDDDSTTNEGVLAAASDRELLSSKAFGICSHAELEQLYVLMRHFRIDPPSRRSRRSQAHPLGTDIDLRATLRAAHRTAGDPLRRVYRRRRSRPRRVVLLADVSGSMESYARAYLYLLHGAVRSINAEAFVFGTQLHRLTRYLSLQQPTQALAEAMKNTPDWSGGTRIGEALGAFNDGYGRRGVGRGAIVVIVSDGWEGGDPALIAREMARLSRMAHRIVWVNPRKQRADYQPLVGGMAAALPWVDEFVSGHSADALTEVIAAIRRE